MNITPLYLGGPFFCGHSVVQDLELPKCGTLKIRSAVGHRVDADLVQLCVALSDLAHQQYECYLNILCVVCPSLDSEEMILTGEAVRLLCDSASAVNAVTRSGTSTDPDSPVGPADAADDNDSALLYPEDDSEIDQAEGQSVLSDTESPSLDLRKANAETLREEQLANETLKGWWRLANLHKGNFSYETVFCIIRRKF